MTKRSQLLANLSSVTKAQCYGEKCPRSVLESSKRERYREGREKILFSAMVVGPFKMKIDCFFNAFESRGGLVLNRCVGSHRLVLNWS